VKRVSYNKTMVKKIGDIWDILKCYFWVNPEVYISIFLLFLGIFVYSFGFNNQMFWDDDDFILKNVYIKSFSYFPKYFSENVIAGSSLLSNYWRPVLLTVFAVEWKFFGESVFGWHLVNAFIHSLNAILVFLFLKKIFQRRIIAFISALVFLIHPVQVEAVAYVNSLGDSLSVLFILITLKLLLNFYEGFKKFSLLDRASYLILILSFYAFAQLSKETAIVTGPLGFLIIFYKSKYKDLFGRIKETALYTFPLFIFTVGYLVLRATIFNFKNTFNLYDKSTLFSEHLYVRVFTFFKSLSIYIGLVFWPRSLHMERSVDPIVNPFVFSAIPGLILIAFTIYITLKFWKIRNPIWLGLLWFFIAFIPTSNILIPINGMLYEHWLYLPIIGMGIIIGLVIESMLSEFQNGKTLIVTVLIVIFLFLGTRSVLRIKEWANPIVFYNQTLKFAPDSYRIYNNLGMAYSDEYMYKEALASYEKAITLDPRNPVAYHNRGNLFGEVGRYDLAEKDFRQAISLDPNFIFSYRQLYISLVNQGKKEEAENLLRSFR